MHFKSVLLLTLALVISGCGNPDSTMAKVEANAKQEPETSQELPKENKVNYQKIKSSFLKGAAQKSSLQAKLMGIKRAKETCLGDYFVAMDGALESSIDAFNAMVGDDIISMKDVISAVNPDEVEYYRGSACEMAKVFKRLKSYGKNKGDLASYILPAVGLHNIATLDDASVSAPYTMQSFSNTSGRVYGCAATASPELLSELKKTQTAVMKAYIVMVQDIEDKIFDPVVYEGFSQYDEDFRNKMSYSRIDNVSSDFYLGIAMSVGSMVQGACLENINSYHSQLVDQLSVFVDILKRS